MTVARWPRRRMLIALALLPLLTRGVRAEPVPAEVSAELAGSRLLGAGRLTWFGLSVYDARLWTQERFSADRFEREPLALELQYARSLHGNLIAERSLVEMRRHAALDETDAARWLASMRRLFPDVARGDRLTGVHQPGESVRFYFNGVLRGEVRDADFARRFFGIWLSPSTSEPKLRLALLGASKGGA